MYQKRSPLYMDGQCRDGSRTSIQGTYLLVVRIAADVRKSFWWEELILGHRVSKQFILGGDKKIGGNEVKTKLGGENLSLALLNPVQELECGITQPSLGIAINNVLFHLTSLSSFSSSTISQTA